MNQTAYILIGAPGSGKSTKGKELALNNDNVVRLCPDEFRAKFGWGEGDQSVSAQAFEATREGMRHALSSGKDVVVDATNMYRKTRKQFLDIAHSFKATTIAMAFEVPKSVLIQRNQARGAQGGRNVPEHVIDAMLSKYEPPTELEFDKVEIVKA